MRVMSFYQATLTVRSPLLLTPDHDGENVHVSMPLALSRLPLKVWRHKRYKLQQLPPSTEQLLVLYPRTNAQGYLWRGTTLQSWSDPTEELEREVGFHALGKLFKVDKQEALLVLGILPNPKGHLPKPFALPLVASLEVLEGLLEVGSGLEVWGELKAKSGRVVVTQAKLVALPPAKERPKRLEENAKKETVKAGKPLEGSV